ncbi:HpcH/HpaI aldolase/citrate lyase family protein [Larkinella bovis]|uniref:HpcH/HpaI aldolase/citrate lyase family protein n=1 Tax=Larkinella bovis TaxID=683041 RepID=A0ABW0IH76_9BACT
MAADTLIQKLEQGQVVYGTCLIANSPLWLNALSGAKLDFIFLDTEHIPADRSSLAHTCQQLNAMGITPVVRISHPDPFLAVQALDAGAKAIVAPYIETAEQLRMLAGAVKYRPLKGKKLEAILSGSEPLSAQLDAYLRSYNHGTMLIANIESTPAIANLDALLATPGLDGVFIGPHDLSVSLGLPEQYDHPDFEAAVRTIIRKTRAVGKHVGAQFWQDPSVQIKWAKEGLNMVIHSNDLTFFKQKLEADMARIRTGIDQLP